MKLLNKAKQLKGFTIVELLIVVVVIGILAAITIVSFGGITRQANTASAQTDLDSNSRKLQLYYTQYGSYPTALDGSYCPTAPSADTNYCLKASSGTTLTYQGNSVDYSLYATKSSTVYKTTPTAAPFQTKLATTCPSGFIVVPGSTTYGTSDFCVMKYEAKCALTASPTVGLTSPNGTYGYGVYSYDDAPCTAANSKSTVSTVSGYPISNINAANATSIASNVPGCSGCNIISEAQWMTIAQNVLSNPVNWSGNAVGSGYIYSGHNDGAPDTPLIASDDSNGYYGTGNTSGNQKRTLTLTNGETIWDFAGSVREITGGVLSSGQPSPTGWAWREWTAVSGGTFAVNPYPSNTGLSGAGTWTSTNGLGKVHSNSSAAYYPYYMVRGGDWGDTVNAGVLSLILTFEAGFTNYSTGFRSTR